MGRSRSPRRSPDRYAKRHRSRSKDSKRADRSESNSRNYRELDGRGRKDDRVEDKIRRFEERKKQDAADSQIEWGRMNRLESDEKPTRSRVELLEEAKTGPFIRYADDARLNENLKQRVRWDDPARGFVADLRPTIQKHRFQPNRFGIEPGKRWDGVDRSNGFEAKFFKKEASERVLYCVTGVIGRGQKGIIVNGMFFILLLLASALTAMSYDAISIAERNRSYVPDDVMSNIFAQSGLGELAAWMGTCTRYRNLARFYLVGKYGRLGKEGKVKADLSKILSRYEEDERPTLSRNIVGRHDFRLLTMMTSSQSATSSSSNQSALSPYSSSSSSALCTIYLDSKTISALPYLMAVCGTPVEIGEYLGMLVGRRGMEDVLGRVAAIDPSLVTEGLLSSVIEAGCSKGLISSLLSNFSGDRNVFAAVHALLDGEQVDVPHPIPTCLLHLLLKARHPDIVLESLSSSEMDDLKVGLDFWLALLDHPGHVSAITKILEPGNQFCARLILDPDFMAQVIADPSMISAGLTLDELEPLLLKITLKTGHGAAGLWYFVGGRRKFRTADVLLTAIGSGAGPMIVARISKLTRDSCLSERVKVKVFTELLSQRGNDQTLKAWAQIIGPEQLFKIIQKEKDDADARRRAVLLFFDTFSYTPVYTMKVLYLAGLKEGWDGEGECFQAGLDGIMRMVLAVRSAAYDYELRELLELVLAFIGANLGKDVAGMTVLGRGLLKTVLSVVGLEGLVRAASRVAEDYPASLYALPALLHPLGTGAYTAPFNRFRPSINFFRYYVLLGVPPEASAWTVGKKQRHEAQMYAILQDAKEYVEYYSGGEGLSEKRLVEYVKSREFSEAGLEKLLKWAELGKDGNLLVRACLERGVSEIIISKIIHSNPILVDADTVLLAALNTRYSDRLLAGLLDMAALDRSEAERILQMMAALHIQRSPSITERLGEVADTGSSKRCSVM